MAVLNAVRGKAGEIVASVAVIAVVPVPETSPDNVIDWLPVKYALESIDTKPNADTFNNPTASATFGLI